MIFYKQLHVSYSVQAWQVFHKNTLPYKVWGKKKLLLAHYTDNSMDGASQLRR